VPVKNPSGVAGVVALSQTRGRTPPVVSACKDSDDDHQDPNAPRARKVKKGDGHDPPATWQLDFARSGAVATERQMRTHGVVVTEVSAKQASEMPLVEHNEMIEAFPADGADDALGEGILPGRVGRDEDLVHAHAVDSTVKGVAVDRVTIPEEIAWGRVVGERLDDLLGAVGWSVTLT